MAKKLLKPYAKYQFIISFGIEYNEQELNLSFKVQSNCKRFFPN